MTSIQDAVKLASPGLEERQIHNPTFLSSLGSVHGPTLETVRDVRESLKHLTFGVA